MTLSLDWIGGFFDADGSVGLSRRVRKRRGRETIEFVPFLSIGQSDAGILEAIAKEIGGKVFKTGRRGDGNGWGVIQTRDSYMLRADNLKCIEIARRLVPVTHVKRHELIEVITYYDTFNNYTKGWSRWKHHSDEYARRYTVMITEGDACRARINLLRLNKDTLNVAPKAE